MAFVVVMDLADLYSRSDTDLRARFSEQYLQTKLDDAVALINAEHPNVADRLVSGALLENNYYRVVADMVLRVTRNPGGFSAESEGGASWSLNSVVASGNLWLTQSDRDLLDGVVRRGRPIPGTISVGLDAGYA